MHDSFYDGVLSLLFKKRDICDLNNWRHLTLMNVDYKIFAKIISNRISDVLDCGIMEEQTCVIKGRVMWDNLNLREVIYEECGDGFMWWLWTKRRLWIMYRGSICGKF